MSASSDSDFIGSSLNRFAASPPWQMQTRYRKSPAKLQRIERLEHQCRRLTNFARMQRHKSANERHLNGVPLRNICRHGASEALELFARRMDCRNFASFQLTGAA